MIVPLRTDARLRTTPYMNWAIILLNVLIWLGQILIHPRDPDVAAWWQRYMLSPAAPELFSFITYGFLHATVMHIGFNMLFLYIFGNNVNDKMGHIGYLAFYLASTVMAGIAYCIWDKEAGPVLGASGAVAAVTGAFLVLFPRSSITLFVLFFMGIIEIPSLWFVVAFFVQDVVNLTGASDVAHSAHVGGTLFGFTVCTILLAFNLLPRDQFDIVALIKQWNRRRQYRDAVRTGWNPYAGTSPQAGGPYRPAMNGWVAPPPPTPDVIDPRQQQILELRARITDAITNHQLSTAANLYLDLKTLDPQSVLALQSQLDIANQLASEQRYPHAAEAYDTFLRTYPKYEQTDQVELMYGLILARFLKQPAKAREHLLKASAKLMNENAQRLAREALEQVNAELAASGGPPPFPGTPRVGGAI